MLKSRTATRENPEGLGSVGAPWGFPPSTYLRPVSFLGGALGIPSLQDNTSPWAFYLHTYPGSLPVHLLQTADRDSHPGWTVAAVHSLSSRGISEVLQYCHGVQAVCNAGSQSWSSSGVTSTISGPCSHINKILLYF